MGKPPVFCMLLPFTSDTRHVCFFFFFFQTKQFFQFSADTNWVSPVLTLFGVRKDSTREGLSTIMRQVVDAHPLLQGKILGDPFSVDQNSKTRIAEQLRE